MATWPGGRPRDPASLQRRWEKLIVRAAPVYLRLDEPRRERFVQYLDTFLARTTFLGKQRMRVTDAVRVTVGASAVRLVLELGIDRLESVRRVHVYPHSVPLDGGMAGGRVSGRPGDLTIELGWEQVLKGLEYPRDGYDVLVHEFAHVLDHDGGTYDGTPRLRATQEYDVWASVLHRNFLDHWFREEAQSAVLRRHGALSQAEFFAVATEAFFEMPELLEKHLPDLHFKLRRFYGYDPVTLELASSAK